MRCLQCYEPSQDQILIVPLLVQMITKENYDTKVKPLNHLVVTIIQVNIYTLTLDTMLIVQAHDLPHINTELSTQIPPSHQSLFYIRS